METMDLSEDYSFDANGKCGFGCISLALRGFNDRIDSIFRRQLIVLEDGFDESPLG